MALEPIFAYQAPAFALALTQTLRNTFNALADMYDRKDGPWVDELRDATIRGGLPLSDAELHEIDALFDDMREPLTSSAATYDTKSRAER